MLILTEVTSFAIDPSTSAPLVILKETLGDRTLPIIIGPCEANAIAIKSLNVQPERPLTIDLVKMVVESLRGALDRVVVYDLVDGVYFARLHIQSQGGVVTIDCRPSDAIALAMRCQTSIFVEDRVFEKSCTTPIPSEGDAIRKNIKGLDTLDFGTYQLQ